MREEEKEEYRTVSLMRLTDEWKRSAGAKPEVFDFAEDFYYFLIFLPLILLVLRLTGAAAAVCLSTVAVPIHFALLTFFRRRLKKIGLSLLTGIVCTAGFLWLFAFAANYAALVFSAAALIVFFAKVYGQYRKLLAERDHERVFTGAVFLRPATVYAAAFLNFGVYLIALYYGFGALELACFAVIAVLLALFVLYQQQSGLHCFTKWNRLAGVSENGADGGIFNVLPALFVCVGTALLSLFALAVYHFFNLARMDYAVLSFFSKLAHVRVPVNPEQTTSGGPKSQTNPTNLIPKGKSADSNLFFLLFGYVIRIIGYTLVAIIVLVILLAVFRALVAFYRSLGENVNEQSRSLFSLEKTVETAKEKLRRTGQKFDFRSKGGNHTAIRRLFWRYVRLHGRQKIKASDTPLEIGGQLSRAEAATLYEKARYSNTECADEDVKRMREALK